MWLWHLPEARQCGSRAGAGRARDLCPCPSWPGPPPGPSACTALTPVARARRSGHSPAGEEGVRAGPGEGRTQGGQDGTDHSGWWILWGVPKPCPPAMPLRTKKETRGSNQPEGILPAPGPKAHTHGGVLLRVNAQSAHSATQCGGKDGQGSAGEFCVWRGRVRLGGTSQEEDVGISGLFGLFLHSLLPENLAAIQGRPPWAEGQSLRTASVLFVFLGKFPSHSESWLGPLTGNAWWVLTGVEEDWG